jgi:hypothetical protein
MGDVYTAPASDKPAFNLSGDAKGGLVREASPSLAECQDALVSSFTDDHVSTRVGHTLCVQSRSGEGLAAITVSAFDSESYEMDVAVTVWRLQ